MGQAVGWYAPTNKCKNAFHSSVVSKATLLASPKRGVYDFCDSSNSNKPLEWSGPRNLYPSPPQSPSLPLRGSVGWTVFSAPRGRSFNHLFRTNPMRGVRTSDSSINSRITSKNQLNHLDRSSFSLVLNSLYGLRR